ncbi:MAG: lysophospholipid acyltransferase family protein, partial [Fusobacteriaceae bacterium]
MDEQRKYRFYGNFLYYLLKIIDSTVKITQVFPENFDKKSNFVLAFWHNKLVMTLLGVKFIEKKVGLASPSKDGELISVPLEKYGTELIRGSSDKESVKSLIKLIKKAKEGYTVGTPVDGPKGPIYTVKPGMIYIAQKSGLPIVPMGVAYSSKWIFKRSWDQFQLPKPFSKGIVVLGEPYYVSVDADMEKECEI